MGNPGPHCGEIVKKVRVQQMIAGVLFDMDGVLFDTERLAKEGWTQAAEQLGLEITEEFLSRLRGTNVADSRVLYKQTFHRDDYDRARAIRLAHSDAVIAREGVPMKPGVRELLETLRQRDIPAALASGTSRDRAMGYLRSTGIDKYFACAVCGDEVLHAKPDPDIFLRAARSLRLDPKKCMVVEDSPNGVAAGHAAGCFTVMVPDLSPSTPALAQLYDACVPSLLDVIPLLDQM